jgi:hypothetical protein
MPLQVWCLVTGLISKGVNPDPVHTLESDKSPPSDSRSNDALAPTEALIIGATVRGGGLIDQSDVLDTMSRGPPPPESVSASSADSI